MHFPVITTLETDMRKLGNIYYTVTHQVDRALNLFESDTWRPIFLSLFVYKTLMETASAGRTVMQFTYVFVIDSFKIDKSLIEANGG